MNLTATTNTARTGHAGRHEKALPAGTAVTFDADRIGPDGWVKARVVNRPRVRVWVHMDAITAA